jgi:hypothetical protein
MGWPRAEVRRIKRGAPQRERHRPAVRTPVAWLEGLLNERRWITSVTEYGVRSLQRDGDAERHQTDQSDTE